MSYNDQIQVALVEAEQEPAVKDTIELSTGVVLKFKKIPIMRISAIVDAFPYPKVPRVYDKDKDRWEENPLSKEYLDMKAEVDTQRTMAIIDAVVAMGTELITKPDNVPAIDSDEWIEELEVIHIQVRRDSKLARYLAWVKFVAIVDTEDLGKIASEFGLTLGISESRIATAVQENFPDNQGQNTAPRS